MRYHYRRCVRNIGLVKCKKKLSNLLKCDALAMLFILLVEDGVIHTAQIRSLSWDKAGQGKRQVRKCKKNAGPAEIPTIFSMPGPARTWTYKLRLNTSFHDICLLSNWPGQPAVQQSCKELQRCGAPCHHGTRTQHTWSTVIIILGWHQSGELYGFAIFLSLNFPYVNILHLLAAKAAQ